MYNQSSSHSYTTEFLRDLAYRGAYKMLMPATAITQYCNQRQSYNARLPNLKRGILLYLPNSYPCTSHLSASYGKPWLCSF